MFKEILKSKPTVMFLIILVGFFAFKVSFYFYLFIAITLIVLLIISKQSRILLLFLLVSISIGGFTNFMLNIDNYKIYKSAFSEYVKFKGKIESKIGSNKFGTKYKCNISITDDKLVVNDNLPVILIVSLESQQYSVGDELVGTGRLSLPKPDYYPQSNRLDNLHIQNGTIANLSVKYSSLESESSNILLLWNKKQIDFVLNVINAKFKSHSNIISALLLGSKSGLDEELVNEFIATGVVHILSVSGFHISIISIGLYFLLYPIKNRWIKFIVLSFCLLELVALTDFAIPAIKSALITLLLILSLNIKRYPNLLDISSSSALLMLIFDYTLLANISFLLSSFALFGIVVFSKPLYQALDRIQKGKFTYLKAVVATSLAAGFVANIIVAYYFGTYSFLSAISNLLVVPIYTIVLIYSVLTLVLSQIFISDYFANLTIVLIDIANFVNHKISEFSWLYIEDLSKALLIALVSPVLIWYTLQSLNYRNFILRAMFSLSFILLSLVLMDNDSIINENKKISSLELKRKEKKVMILKFKELPNRTILQATRSYVKHNDIDEVVSNYKFGLDSTILIRKVNTELLNNYFKKYEN